MPPVANQAGDTVQVSGKTEVVKEDKVKTLPNTRSQSLGNIKLLNHNKTLNICLTQDDRRKENKTLDRKSRVDGSKRQEEKTKTKAKSICSRNKSRSGSSGQEKSRSVSTGRSGVFQTPLPQKPRNTPRHTAPGSSAGGSGTTGKVGNISLQTAPGSPAGGSELQDGGNISLLAASRPPAGGSVRRDSVPHTNKPIYTQGNISLLTASGPPAGGSVRRDRVPEYKHILGAGVAPCHSTPCIPAGRPELTDARPGPYINNSFGPLDNDKDLSTSMEKLDVAGDCEKSKSSNKDNIISVDSNSDSNSFKTIEAGGRKDGAGKQATESAVGKSRQQPLLLHLPMKLLRLRYERRERKASTQQLSQHRENLH